MTNKDLVVVRRDFLRAMACGAAAVALRPFEQTVRADTPITAAKLAENVTEIVGDGANILLVTTPNGAILVDDGLAERSAQLQKTVLEHTGGQPVSAVFNTHWHPENTGGNAAFVKAGARIIAHENTRLTMGTDLYIASEDRIRKALPMEMLPTETFYASSPVTKKVEIGGEPVEYGYLPQAHTDGDIYVFFPKANVLMAGDVVSVGSYPLLDNASGGWLGGMNQAPKILLNVVNEDTKIIPGHGPVQTRADLQAQSEMASAVYQRLVKLMKQGMSVEDMIAADPTKDFDAKWGNPDVLIASAYRGLWGHARELGGVI